MAMPQLYRILAAFGSTHFSSPPSRAGHPNASFRMRRGKKREKGLKPHGEAIVFQGHSDGRYRSVSDPVWRFDQISTRASLPEI